MDWVYTLMNIGTFAFIGLLIWLYFKPVEGDKSNDNESSEDQPS